MELRHHSVFRLSLDGGPAKLVDLVSGLGALRWEPRLFQGTHEGWWCMHPSNGVAYGSGKLDIGSIS